MTVQTMLVDDLVKEANFRLTGSRTIDSGLDGSLRFALDWALKSFVRDTQPQSFETAATISTTAGTQEYDLADDFDQMLPDGVRFSASPYTQLARMSRSQYDRQNYATQTNRARPTHYILLGRSSSTRAVVMRLFPNPVTTAVIIKYHYRAFPDSVRSTVEGDAAVIDKRFPVAHYLDLVDGALSKMSSYLTSEERRNYEMLFRAAKDSMRANASHSTGEGTQPDPLGAGSVDLWDDLFDTTVT